MNIKELQNFYLVGIKGSGMVGVAEVLQAWEKKVVGSDTEEKFFSDEILQRKNIPYFEGFSRENIASQEKIDLIVYSSAYNLETNPELAWAKEQELLMMSYPEFLGQLSKEKYSIAVCGTHGKTTTTAMLALAMRDAGADPLAVVGSKMQNVSSNVLPGKGIHFVFEADEYQNKFEKYFPTGVIMTNLDYDHPDFFPNFEDYKKVFKDFVRKIPPFGFLVAFGGDADVCQVAMEAKCKIFLYGDPREEARDRTRKEFEERGIKSGNLEFLDFHQNLSLKVPGKHNKLNAAAVFGVAKALKLDEEKIEESLENFSGTARRFEILGERNGAIIIDDYAHHPKEIKATLLATREKYVGKKVICVFHPHTFTRTKALLDDFADSFDNADEVIVLDIYGSAREKQGGVSSAELVEKMKKFRGYVYHIPTIDGAFDFLKVRLTENDVVITMGAGNVFELGEKLVG